MPFVSSSEAGIFICAAVGLIRPEDVPDLKQAERKFFTEHPTAKARFLCDCTGMKIISPEARDVLLSLMREDTPRLARAAFVVEGDGVNALQIRAMIREVGSPKRQTFTSVDDAMKWLRSPLER